MNEHEHILYCAQNLNAGSEIFGSSLMGTDIFMLLLAESKTAIVFLHSNQSIALDITETTVATYNNTVIGSGPNQTSCPTTLPFSYFSATSLASNSTLIYMYYQLNDTFMGEIIYNTIERTWASEPAHLPFF